MAKRRIKRKITRWQTNDQGANPLTARGRKYIKKEIKRITKIKEKQLRKALESQTMGGPDINSPYWSYIDSHGFEHESWLANPDTYGDDTDNTVDGDYETY